MKGDVEYALPAVRDSRPARFAFLRRRRRERVLYARRPGLGALPEGGMAMLGFAGLQLFPVTVLLWAIWWPMPRTTGGWAFSLVSTGLIATASLMVLWLLIRPRAGTVTDLVFVPFVRLVVTDRRVFWALPWKREPMFQLAHERVRGGAMGQAGRLGWAPAAILLWPGDPMGDDDGMIRFDRVPDARRFVAALDRMGTPSA